MDVAQCRGREFRRLAAPHNAALHPDEHTGFFGLDIYNMNASISAVVEYLERFNSVAARVARVRYGCLTPWQRDPATYGRAALTTGYAKCEAPVLLALHDLLARQLEYETQDRDSFLDRPERSADCFRRALLSRHVLRYCGVLEPTRSTSVRDA